MKLMLIPAAAVMLLLMLCRRVRYQISLWKTIAIVITVAALGVMCTCLLYFMENGEWGGMSFFGAVLFIPPLVAPIAKILRVRVSSLMDFIAPSGLLMFAVMKANCYFSGCCGGRVMWYSSAGQPVLFPSQLIEAFCTVGLVALLVYLEHKGNMNDRLYPFSLITYGVLRFVLNWFREQNAELVFGLQKGTVWSLVAIIMGTVWLLIIANIKVNKQYKEMHKVTSDAE